MPAIPRNKSVPPETKVVASDPELAKANAEKAAAKRANTPAAKAKAKAKKKAEG